MSQTDTSTLSLLQGEFTLGTPPTTQLNGQDCVPQHYLQYQHNIESVEALVFELEFDPHFPVFVCQDNTGIYIQVGIIGVDNYLAKEQQKTKIVYGRKWRVEPNLPTSEIIQTVLLALKTAREHELRELFKLKTVDTSGGTSYTTTPFNNHHDLPLLVRSYRDKNMLENTDASLSWQQIAEQLKQVNYAGLHFSIASTTPLSHGKTLVELNVHNYQNSLIKELQDNPSLHLILAQKSFNEVLFTLLEHLVMLSNRYVEENFTFRGIARFSRKYSVSQIAELSLQTRQLHKRFSHQEFAQQWLQLNYETDLTRVPSIRPSKLHTKLMQQFEQIGPIAGPLPFHFEHNLG